MLLYPAFEAAVFENVEVCAIIVGNLGDTGNRTCLPDPEDRGSNKEFHIEFLYSSTGREL